jgi:RNA polymerase sigma factor (sigma-70 family)
MASAAPEIPVLARNQAFETLYRSYVADVYHYALALVRNPADAEDVTQTTFLNALRAYEGGVEVEKPQNWLIKIAHNVARSRYARARSRVNEVPLDDHVDQLALPEEERPNIEALLRALWRLPFNQRAALVMRELEGRTYAEIADTIGVSVSAVETLIFRARRSMRTKASSVRSLAAIPLPGSLANMFGGGGATVGGGGLLGAGVLLKAGVAIVAGAVATGVLMDKTIRGDVAHRHAPAGSSSLAPDRTSARSAQLVHRPKPVASAAVAVRESSAPRSPSAGEAGSATAAEAASAPNAERTGVLPTQGQSLPSTTTRVTDLITTTESAVSASVPTLTVTVPSVPPLPVPVPQPPPVPTLP